MTFTSKYFGDEDDDEEEDEKVVDNNELDETYSFKERLALSINSDATSMHASGHQHCGGIVLLNSQRSPSIEQQEWDAKALFL
jgi:hypothetical protein